MGTIEGSQKRQLVVSSGYQKGALLVGLSLNLKYFGSIPRANSWGL